MKGNWILGIGVLAITAGTVAAPTHDVGAARTYRRTRTVAASKLVYRAKNSKGATYRPGSTKKFVFRRNHYLQNYSTTTWTRICRTYIYKGGKKPTMYYYVINNSNSKVKGWVWSGYLTRLSTYKRTKNRSICDNPFVVVR